MKLGFFTDSHYSSQELTCGKRYNSRSLEKIKAAYAFFEKEDCDLVVCLGDLTDKEDSHEKEVSNLKEIAEVINNSRISTVCLMGNHDAFTFTEEQFYSVLPNCFPSNKVIGEKTLVFLDACCFTNGNHYAPGDTDWTDTCLPDLSALKEQLADAAGDVYVFIHQNIDPNIQKNHRLSNDGEVRKILKESGKVKTVFEGHYHPGKVSSHDGIEYVTFPAMCENDNAFFIRELL